MNLSCIHIDDVLVNSATQLALFLGLNKSIGDSDIEIECNRTFWVIYSLEKPYCFNNGRTSVGFRCISGYLSD
jgi:hypothetical protein